MHILPDIHTYNIGPYYKCTFSLHNTLVCMLCTFTAPYTGLHRNMSAHLLVHRHTLTLHSPTGSKPGCQGNEHESAQYPLYGGYMDRQTDRQTGRQTNQYSINLHCCFMVYNIDHWCTGLLIQLHLLLYSGTSLQRTLRIKDTSLMRELSAVPTT